MVPELHPCKEDSKYKNVPAETREVVNARSRLKNRRLKILAPMYSVIMSEFTSGTPSYRLIENSIAFPSSFKYVATFP
jgi:hypothetical protein